MEETGLWHLPGLLLEGAVTALLPGGGRLRRFLRPRLPLLSPSALRATAWSADGGAAVAVLGYPLTRSRKGRNLACA